MSRKKLLFQAVLNTYFFFTLRLRIGDWQFVEMAAAAQCETDAYKTVIGTEKPYRNGVIFDAASERVASLSASDFDDSALKDCFDKIVIAGDFFFKICKCTSYTVFGMGVRASCAWFVQKFSHFLSQIVAGMIVAGVEAFDKVKFLQKVRETADFAEMHQTAALAAEGMGWT